MKRGTPVETPDGPGVFVAIFRHEPGWQPFAGLARPDRQFLTVELEDGRRKVYAAERVKVAA